MERTAEAAREETEDELERAQELQMEHVKNLVTVMAELDDNSDGQITLKEIRALPKHCFFVFCFVFLGLGGPGGGFGAPGGGFFSLSSSGDLPPLLLPLKPPPGAPKPPPGPPKPKKTKQKTKRKLNKNIV